MRALSACCPDSRPGTETHAHALLRHAVPTVVARLARRTGDFADAEDAVQDAVVDALETWPRTGPPDDPAAWLTTVAARRHVDRVRSESARRRREESVATDPRAEAAPGADADAPIGTAGSDDGAGGDGSGGGEAADTDEVLALFFLCCHPALRSGDQLALTLRAVGGLTTAEIAAALVVPTATAGQRIVRAKQRLREAGARFELPPEPDRGPRLAVVLHVLYLVFSEGYVASSGDRLRRPDLADRALRLTRRLHRILPGPGEIAGLLALMLLTEARAPARTGPAGELVPLDEQDRTRWNRSAIAEGTALVTESLAGAEIGPYQVQAAIAAVHAEAPSTADTDWPQVLGLYDLLAHLAPGPVVTLNRAVALGEVHGPRAGLDLLSGLDDGLLAGHHRLHAVRAHLSERSGDRVGALSAWREAARRATSVPERRHLLRRAARLE